MTAATEEAAPGFIWVWDKTKRKGCEPCQAKAKGLRPPAGKDHTCGELKPRAEVLAAAMQKRRDEAEERGDCRRCLGTGYVYRYDSKERERVLSATGARYGILDGRGMRYIVPCGWCTQPSERGRAKVGMAIVLAPVAVAFGFMAERVG
jgi:hypothetical protein